jgi:hypothetical protein
MAVQLSSERARQAVRQDCSSNQEAGVSPCAPGRREQAPRCDFGDSSVSRLAEATFEDVLLSLNGSRHRGGDVRGLGQARVRQDDEPKLEREPGRHRVRLHVVEGIASDVRMSATVGFAPWTCIAAVGGSAKLRGLAPRGVLPLLHRRRRRHGVRDRLLVGSRPTTPSSSHAA